MSEPTAHTVRLVGRLQPAPIETRETITERLPSFSVIVQGATVTATPLPGVGLAPDVARQRLAEEMAPLLTAIGFTEHQPTQMEVNRIDFPEGAIGSASAAACALVMRAGARPADETKRRARWVAVDPTYRDLLKLHVEASRAPNPRPAAYKMVERLEQKFGGRKEALKALGLSQGQWKPIVADQSSYSEDRHAKYPVGMEPPPLDATTRAQVVAAIDQIVSAYEERALLLQVGKER